MSLLDSVVDRSFRDEKAGRVVFFSVNRRNRAYLVNSEAEELKIRSFLKMYYFADFSIALLAGQVALAWSSFFANLQSLGDPATHLLRTAAIYLGTSCVLVGLPYFLLWRAYKKGLLSFVFAQDEVENSEHTAPPQNWIAMALFALALVSLGAIFYLIRAK